MSDDETPAVVADTPVPEPKFNPLDVLLVSEPDKLLQALQSERVRSINTCQQFEQADSKYLALKLKALKDAGDQILAEKRLVLEEDALQSDKEVAQRIAQISDAMARNRPANSPFARRVTAEGTPEKPRVIERKDIPIVDTTMNESATKVSYDKFMAENYKEGS